LIDVLEGVHPVADRIKHETKTVLLKKWRFKEDEKGPGGEARYWWSDGSKTEERVNSHMDAVGRLAAVQDSGGRKP
jgi:hypothetical protein